MPLALDDFDSNCKQYQLSGAFNEAESWVAMYLGQHSGGGLHFGGEVKPQLQASRGKDAGPVREEEEAGQVCAIANAGMSGPAG